MDARECLASAGTVDVERDRLHQMEARARRVACGEMDLGKSLEHEYSLIDLLRRPGVGFDAVTAAAVAGGRDVVSRETLRAELGPALADTVIEQIEIDIKYAGYIAKQRDEVERAAAYEHLKLPADLDHSQVTALSFEVRQKLAQQRPETLGQASRISGITPAAISLLLVHLRNGRFAEFRLPAANDGVDKNAAA